MGDTQPRSGGQGQVMAGPRFPCKGAAENKLGWAATLCQQAASTDQAWHGKFPYGDPKIFHHPTFSVT